MAEEKLKKVQQVISSTLDLEHVDPQEDLFEAGYLDSLGIVNLMMALEEEFDVNLSPETMDLEKFRSVESISNSVLPPGESENVMDKTGS